MPKEGLHVIDIVNEKQNIRKMDDSSNMVEKKEGATMQCPRCDAILTCRMSNYKLPYQNKLQWQNEDGSAHYKYDSGKFSCSGDKKARDALREQDEMMREAELSKGSSEDFIDREEK